MNKKLSIFIIIYLIIGLLFAIGFALFYHWPPLAYFSPGFYGVIVSWPIQIPGFIYDFRIYGLAGKLF